MGSHRLSSGEVCRRAASLTLATLATLASLATLLAACSAPSHPAELSTSQMTRSGTGERPPPFQLPSGSTSSSGPAPTTLGCHSDMTCSSLMNCGAVVVPNSTGATAPTPMGGSLNAGTYSLTDVTLFSGLGGSTKSPVPAWFRTTLRFTTPGVSVPDGGEEGGGDGGADSASDSQTDASLDLDAQGTPEAEPTVDAASDADAEGGTQAVGFAPAWFEEVTEAAGVDTNSIAGPVSFSGDTVKVSPMCPQPGPFSAQYTANAGALIIFIPTTYNGTPVVEVNTFTKM